MKGITPRMGFNFKDRLILIGLSAQPCLEAMKNPRMQKLKRPVCSDELIIALGKASELKPLQQREKFKHHSMQVNTSLPTYLLRSQVAKLSALTEPTCTEAIAGGSCRTSEASKERAISEMKNRCLLHNRRTGAVLCQCGILPLCSLIGGNYPGR